jgi:hypothetical protein
VKDLLIQTAKALKGSARSLFMARMVQAMGEGGKLQTLPYLAVF